MIDRIGSNGWFLIRWHVEHLLSSLFPVMEFSNRVDDAPWAKYESKNIDPQRELGPFESWAGNVRVKKYRIHPDIKRLISFRGQLVA